MFLSVHFARDLKSHLGFFFEIMIYLHFSLPVPLSRPSVILFPTLLQIHVFFLINCYCMHVFISVCKHIPKYSVSTMSFVRMFLGLTLHEALFNAWVCSSLATPFTPSFLSCLCRTEIMWAFPWMFIGIEQQFSSHLGTFKGFFYYYI